MQQERSSTEDDVSIGGGGPGPQVRLTSQQQTNQATDDIQTENQEPIQKNRTNPPERVLSATQDNLTSDREISGGIESHDRRQSAGRMGRRLFLLPFLVRRSGKPAEVPNEDPAPGQSHEPKEVLKEDPSVPNPLRALGPAADFWKRYDHLADLHDNRMTENLNANLDVLLIFAALFSAINTSFISLTMPSLSADPLDRTNALLELLVLRADNNTLTATDLTPAFSPQTTSIAVNCLLYASLSCSLLAAMGAMLGKEWLQSFDRSGQTGPLEEQGHYRQRKYNGVQQWYLEAIILFLPNLLLFSVTLFFSGLGLYLLPINKAVAGIVIAFVGLGCVFWCATTIAGAISPLCPYQTAAARAMRHILLLPATIWETFSRFAPRFAARTLSQSSDRKRKQENAKKQRASAQASCWLFETASSQADQLAAVKFICTLEKEGCATVLRDSGHWRQLLMVTQEVFNVWEYEPSETNRDIVEQFGKAVSHVIFQTPESTILRSATDESRFSTGPIGASFVSGIQAASQQLIDNEVNMEFVVHVAFLRTLTFARDLQIGRHGWANISARLSDPDIGPLDGRLRTALYHALHSLKPLQPRAASEMEVVEIYSDFLQKLRYIAVADRFNDKLRPLLWQSVAEWMLEVNRPTKSSSSDERLVKFSVEAIFALRAINDCDWTWSAHEGILGDRRKPVTFRDDWSERSIEPTALQALWATFDRITGLPEPSRLSIQCLGPELILETLEWISNSLPTDQPMTGLERYPRIVTYFVSGMGDKDPKRRARWFDIFVKNGPRWFHGSDGFLQVWLNCGLVEQFLANFKQSQTREPVWRVLGTMKGPQGIPNDFIEWLWRTFDLTVSKDPKTQSSTQAIGPELVVEALEWLSYALPKYQLMTGLEDHPKTISHIISGLGDRNGEIRDRWVQLFIQNRSRWFHRYWEALALWMDAGLGDQLLVCYNEPQTREVFWKVLDAFRREDEMPQEVFEWLWPSCDSIIEQLRVSSGEVQSFGPSFILEILEWISRSLSRGEIMTGLEDHPRIPAYATSGLVDGDDGRRERWLQLFFNSKVYWFEQSPYFLDYRWIRAGLGARLLSKFRQPHEWNQEAWIVDIIQTAVYSSPLWSFKLVSDGFIGIASRVMLYIDQRRGLFRPEWRELLENVLEILLRVWQQTSNKSKFEWATDDVLEGIHPAVMHATMELRSTRGSPEYVVPLGDFVEYLAHRRQPSAFISRGSSASVNGFYDELERRAELDEPLPPGSWEPRRPKWNYSLYDLIQETTPCSRSSYVEFSLL